MRIAFISHEFAGNSGGGIGTYVRNAAEMMSAAGHHVHVFTSGSAVHTEWLGANLAISTVLGKRECFHEAVAIPFRQAYESGGFDVVEGPEFGCDAKSIAENFPQVPLVVRLHTPNCMISEINASFVSGAAKLRFMFGGLRHGRLAQPYWHHKVNLTDPERLHVLSADQIVAPSRAILDHLDKLWQLPLERAEVVANVFNPSRETLSFAPTKQARTILFLGKLEVRKGVLDLARAVPMVAHLYPDVRFVFVGRDLPLPGSSKMVSDAMYRAYGAWHANVTHINEVDYADIPQVLANASVVVLPSIWENFPYVCLEAMAAARAVVGSSAGGMAEIIDHGENGLLVPPRDPDAIAEALIGLLASPKNCERFGLNARQKIQETFSSSRILPQQIQAYKSAIHNAGRRNPGFRYR